MKNLMKLALAATGLSLLGSAQAVLIDTRFDLDPGTSNFVKDGVISAAEYGAANSYSYTGGGSGFGGTVGAGTLYMDFSSTNINFGFKAGGNINDNVVIFIDSRAGGFTDATMNDTGDGGRNVSTNLSRDADDVFDPNFLPDYTIVIGSFGIVSFELTSGTLNFIDYDGTFTGNDPSVAREYSLSKSSLSIGDGFNFLVGYCSDSGYLSDETIPGQAFTGTGNPGFGSGTNDWSNYNSFQAVPEPGTFAALGVGALVLLRRRKR